MTAKFKENLLSSPWLVGLSSACFVFAGSTARGNLMLGLGLGVLGTAFVAIDYNVKLKRELALRHDSYEQGLAHGQRRTTSR